MPVKSPESESKRHKRRGPLQEEERADLKTGSATGLTEIVGERKPGIEAGL